MKSKVFLLAAAFVLTSAWAGYAGEDATLYSFAGRAVKTGRLDYAFMYHNQILREYPNSKYKGMALFAVGEYYFFLPNYRDSAGSFKKFVEAYPDSRLKLFALGYLLKIAHEQKDKDRISELENEIITLKKVSLVFRDFKEYRHRSPLGKNLRAVFQINKIEFFVQEVRLAEISF